MVSAAVSTEVTRTATTDSAATDSAATDSAATVTSVCQSLETGQWPRTVCSSCYPTCQLSQILRDDIVSRVRTQEHFS
jgi:hypothetical protein